VNRAMRKATRAQITALAKKRPVTLTEIPSEEWPANRHDPDRTHVWESREFLVQMFDAPLFDGIDVRRVSVCRVTMNDAGRWDDNITWDELMQVKREIGFGHWYRRRGLSGRQGHRKRREHAAPLGCSLRDWKSGGCDDSGHYLKHGEA
jgi:hypothetical protein